MYHFHQGIVVGKYYWHLKKSRHSKKNRCSPGLHNTLGPTDIRHHLGTEENSRYCQCLIRNRET